MPDCAGTDFQKIEVLSEDDADRSQVVKAEIVSIDRTARTATISYLGTCEGFTRTTGIEFFYYCENSIGDIRDLEDGHLAFAPEDIVYVSRFLEQGEVAERLYIIGHVDIRDTKPCKREWYVLRGGESGPFVIIDIVTGQLYDGWHEVDWPLHPQRLPFLEVNNGKYKIDEFRDWVTNRKSLVTMYHRNAWDYVQYNSSLGRYELKTYLDSEQWDSRSCNQFRVGFSWKPGVLQGVRSNRNYYGPTDNDELSTSGPFQLCSGVSTCQMWHTYGTKRRVSGYEWPQTEFHVFYDTYDLSFNNDPPYNPANHNAVAADNVPSIGVTASFESSLTLDDYHHYHVMNSAYSPTQNSYGVSYEATTRSVSSGVGIQVGQVWSYFNHYSVNYDLWAYCAFFVEDGDVVFSNLNPTNFSTEMEMLGGASADYGCCYASTDTWDWTQTTRVDVSFSFAAPWVNMNKVFHRKTIVNTASYSYDNGTGEYVLEMSGDPYFIYFHLNTSFGNLTDDQIRKYYTTDHSEQSRTSSSSIFITHGDSGVWGLSVGAYWGDNAVSLSGTGNYSDSTERTYTFDVDNLVIVASMGHLPKNRYENVAEVKLSDLYEVAIPTGVLDAIKLVLTDNMKNNPARIAMFPEPYGSSGGITDTNFNYPVQIEIFPVMITPPPM